jgi:glycosyltransferase involved in cell wall biosynthesis
MLEKMEYKVLIIIPAFNEEKTVANVLLSLRQVVPDFDRVVVNDGSTDATAEIIRQLGEKQVLLPCNLGYGRALQTGIKYALIKAYDIVVSFDADGQHRPEDVPCLVDALLDGAADMVIGSRYCDGRPYSGPFNRKLGQILFSYLTRWLIGFRVYDTSSGFKAFRANVCEEIVDRTFWDFHTETIVRLSLNDARIFEYPIIVRERDYGRSMHSYMSIIEYPLKTLLLIVVAAMDGFLERRTK